MITLGTRTFYRHYTQSQFETNVDYGYGTDYTLSHQRQVTITSGDAIYYLGFILQHRTNPSIFSSAFWKIERVSGVNTVSVRDRETDPWVLHPNQSNYQALNITLLNIFGLGFVNNFFTEEAGSGTYDVLEKIYQDGDPIPTPASVWAFDLRYLVLRGLAPLKDKVDPVSKNNKCQLRGEWRTLPVSTTLYAGGWTPTSALSWTLELKDTALNNIAVVTGSTAVTAPAPVTGKIADFSYDWDCKSTAGKTKYGVTFPVAFASASVPNAGQTTSRKLNTRVLCTRCACVDGILRMLLSLDSVGSDAGNPLTATMAFSGMFASDAPASMGYGWKSNTGIRVYEDPVNLDQVGSGGVVGKGCAKATPVLNGRHQTIRGSPGDVDGLRLGVDDLDEVAVGVILHLRGRVDGRHTVDRDLRAMNLAQQFLVLGIDRGWIDVFHVIIGGYVEMVISDCPQASLSVVGHGRDGPVGTDLTGHQEGVEWIVKLKVADVDHVGRAGSVYQLPAF